MAVKSVSEETSPQHVPSPVRAETVEMVFCSPMDRDQPLFSVCAGSSAAHALAEASYLLAAIESITGSAVSSGEHIGGNEAYLLGFAAKAAHALVSSVGEVR